MKYKDFYKDVLKESIGEQITLKDFIDTLKSNGFNVDVITPNTGDVKNFYDFEKGDIDGTISERFNGKWELMHASMNDHQIANEWTNLSEFLKNYVIDQK